MILSFKHRGLKRLYERNDGSKLPAPMLERIEEILTALDTAGDVDALRLPFLRLHKLVGKQKDRWAVTVRANWRITFRFENGNAMEVDFEDYH